MSFFLNIENIRTYNPLKLLLNGLIAFFGNNYISDVYDRKEGASILSQNFQNEALMYKIGQNRRKTLDFRCEDCA